MYPETNPGTRSMAGPATTVGGQVGVGADDVVRCRLLAGADESGFVGDDDELGAVSAPSLVRIRLTWVLAVYRLM